MGAGRTTANIHTCSHADAGVTEPEKWPPDSLDLNMLPMLNFVCTNSAVCR